MSQRKLPPHWRDHKPVAFEEAGVGGFLVFCAIGLAMWALIIWALWRLF